MSVEDRAVAAVAMMLRAVAAGEWSPPMRADGDVALAIAEKAVELVRAESEGTADHGFIDSSSAAENAA